MSNGKLYAGIVEDRNDPMSIGRVRVRVFGLHSEDKGALPTQDLPWAYLLSPTNSASISGVGISPTGILPGTMVLVSFLDGDSCQMPVVIGTLHGVPQGGDAQQNIEDAIPLPSYKTGEEGGISDIPVEEGGGFIPVPTDTIGKEIGSLSKEDYLKLREAIAKAESGGNNTQYNTIGGDNNHFLGRYQIGWRVLFDGGYIKKGMIGKDLVNPSSWTGKDGITNYTEFLKSPEVQDALIRKACEDNHRYMKLRNDTPREVTAGALMAAHLVGHAQTRRFLSKGIDSSDAFGTNCSKYYKLGYASIAGEMPKNLPTEDTLLPLSNIKGTIKGFADPNAIYPKSSTLQEPDTNRIARAQNIDNTIVGYKENDVIKNVRIGGSKETWSQPNIPYASLYPYNNVHVTEGGIVQEFDNTPGAVRHHLYHPSGTYSETDNNGTKVNRIVGDGFTILERDGNVYIKGVCNVTVEGNANLLVQHDCNLEVYGNMNSVVKNDWNTTVHGNMNTYIQGEYNIKSSSFNVESHTGDINLLSANNIDVESKNDLNLYSLKNMNIKCDTDYKLDIVGTMGMSSDGAINIRTNAAYNTYSNAGTNIRANTIMRIYGNGNLSLKSAANIYMDATEIRAQEGSSGIAGTASTTSVTALTDASLRGTVALPATSPDIIITDDNGVIKRQELSIDNIGTLIPPPTRYDSDSRHYEDPDEGDADEYIVKMQSKGVVFPTSIPTASEIFTDYNKSKINNFEDYDYDNFVNEENIPHGVALSQNYSLQQFLIASDGIRSIRPQHGLSEGQIVQNLHYLAVNVVEKVKHLYPNMIITSGYRYAKTGSQHEIGQAVDMQFQGVDKSEYFNIAKQLTEEIAFDKIILEYKNTGSGMPWIHITYRSKQNRGETYTYSDHRNVGNGLRKLA